MWTTDAEVGWNQEDRWLTIGSYQVQSESVIHAEPGHHVGSCAALDGSMHFTKSTLSQVVLCMYENIFELYFTCHTPLVGQAGNVLRGLLMYIHMDVRTDVHTSSSQNTTGHFILAAGQMCCALHNLFYLMSLLSKTWLHHILVFLSWPFWLPQYM